MCVNLANSGKKESRSINLGEIILNPTYSPKNLMIILKSKRMKKEPKENT
jgi:hypothetical protein